MNIGKQIVKFRKKCNKSQEELASLIGVTRQTISKWELGETSPDIKQASMLAKIFMVSLDEMVGIEPKDIIVDKVSNIEKLAGGMIKFFKIFGLTFYGIVLILLISLTIYYIRGKGIDKTSSGQIEFACKIDNKVRYFSVVGNINENEREEDVKYFLEVSDSNGMAYNIDERIYLGKTPYEAMQSVEVVKKFIIYDGGVCN